MLIRITRHAVHVTASVLAVATVVAAVLVWRLAMGPVSLALLTPAITRALSPADAPYTIAFDDTFLAVGGESVVDLEITNLRAIDRDGRVFFSAPEVKVELSVAGLVAGSIVPVSLESVRPFLRLVRDEAGAFSVGPGDATDTSAAGFEQMLADLTGPPDHGRPLGGLSRFALQDGRLVFEDRRSGRQWVADGVDAAILRDETGVRGQAGLAVPFGRPSALIDASFTIAPADGSIDVTLRLAGLDPVLVARDVPDLAGLAAIDADMTATLHAAISAAGDLASGSAEVFVGAGRLVLPDLYREPLAIKGAVAEITLYQGLARVDVTHAELDLGDALIIGDGRVVNLDSDPWLTLQVAIDTVPVATVLRVWPEGLGAGARDWIGRSFEGGTVANATGAFSALVRDVGVSEEPLRNLEIEADVADTTFAYLPPMPPVTGVAGHVSIGAFEVRVDGLKGALGDLAVTDGQARLAKLDGGDGMTSSLAISGPLADALALAADPTLDLPDRDAMAGADVAGTIQGTLELGLPGFVGVTRGDVAFAISGTVGDLALPNEVPGYPLAGGSFVVTVDREALRAEGTIAARGVPLDATWTQTFAAGADPRGTIDVTAVLDDAARAALGLPGAGLMAGPLTTSLRIEDAASGARHYALDADLAAATLDIPALSWSKPAGQPGAVSARWRDGAAGATEITAFRVEGPGLDVAGAATVGGAGQATRITLTRAIQGRNDLRGSVAIDAAGAYDVAIDGGTADLGPYFDRISEDDDEGLPPFKLQARLDRLFLRQDMALTSVDIDLDYADDRFAHLAMTGTMPGGHQLRTSITPGEGGRAFRLEADDGGDALRLFDVIETAHGGNLVIRATIDDADPARPARGTLVASDFQIRDAPVLAQVLSFGSFSGLVTMLSGEGIPFARAKVPFVKRGSLIEIADARAAGGALGITAKGTIDLASETIDVEGTLVPAYTINSLIGEVPILGDILIGEEGGGLFAATYGVRGPYDDPNVSVNPLAALAPGFLRDLLSFEGNPAPDEPPVEGEGRN